MSEQETVSTMTGKSTTAGWRIASAPHVTQGRQKTRSAPRAVDLFSGCGGLSEGLSQAGFRVIGAVEIHPLAVETYKANHPGVEVWSTDIKALQVSSVMKKLKLCKGQLDLLAGCPPCQGFSRIRTLNGSSPVDDERNELITHFLRFVRGMLPRFVMMENVPGLAADQRFKTLCNALKRLGYVVNWSILNARDYGVPQRRKRLMLLAGLRQNVPFASRDAKMHTVREAFARLPAVGESGDPPHDVTENRSERIKKLIASVPHNGGSRTDLPSSRQLECHKRCDGFKDVYGRMAWDDVAPTITGGCFNPSKGRFLHPEEDRAITMREAAILQSFGRDYVFPNCRNKAAIALLIGNALPPEFVRRHAVQVLNLLEACAGAAKAPKSPGASQGNNAG